jgi:sodium-dependent dicarboxylate transporter 2/3/5
LLPIFVPAAAALGLSAPLAAMAVAMAASCAFMLPVATPPNGIVFATGRVPAAVMMRCGLWLNLACTVALTGLLLALAR